MYASFSRAFFSQAGVHDIIKPYNVGGFQDSEAFPVEKPDF